MIRVRMFLHAGASMCLALLLPLFVTQAAFAAPTSLISIELGSASEQATSGRLLVFAIEARTAEALAEASSKTKSNVVTSVNVDLFKPTQTTVMAREVLHWTPKQSVFLDGDDLAFPTGISALPPGDYYLQAVLDVNHNYNYARRSGGDLVSDVVKVQLPLKETPKLTLTRAITTETYPSPLPQAVRASAHDLNFRSTALSAFWGRAVSMRGWVLTPPDYAAKPKERYPVVYFTHGFGADLNTLAQRMQVVHAAMTSGEMPPMIWVFLDMSGPTGIHQFADSVNNGPWGQALTRELIPHLEKQFRMDARANGRFLQGHSSGGWATLWLQTRYPETFGGTWSTSPDPADFRDFIGVDLYLPNANFYRKPDGTATPLLRVKGKVLMTLEEFARLERVQGSQGGQLASFEWVFSPRGKDGMPMPLFDRDTGNIDPDVVAHWREHYDIAHHLQKNWSRLKGSLNGKIHITVGAADNFYLDSAAAQLKSVLDGLGAKTRFEFLPERGHFDVYPEGKDQWALLKRFSWEMYAVARPQSTLKRAVQKPAT
jgi:enterochelin esterase-like enzyme